jgi:hypothetical protein
MGSHNVARESFEFARELGKSSILLCVIARFHSGIALLAARLPSAKAYASSRNPKLGLRS